jgi:hypothetical protein
MTAINLFFRSLFAVKKESTSMQTQSRRKSLQSNDEKLVGCMIFYELRVLRGVKTYKKG